MGHLFVHKINKEDIVLKFTAYILQLPFCFCYLCLEVADFGFEVFLSTVHEQWVN
jgi:hypothetical protein